MLEGGLVPARNVTVSMGAKSLPFRAMAPPGAVRPLYMRGWGGSPRGSNGLGVCAIEDSMGCVLVAGSEAIAPSDGQVI